MGVIVQKQRGVVGFTRIAKISVIGFIVAMATAMIDTVWAVYLDGFFHNVSYVGFFSGFLTLVAFVSLFAFVPVVESHNKSRLYLLALFVFLLSYFLFSVTKNVWVFVFVSIVYSIFASLKLNTYGIIIRDISTEHQLSRNEGLVYSFLNTAWVLGPLIAGYVLGAQGVSKVFIMSCIFIFSAIVLFKFSRINDSNISKKPDKHILRNFLDFFKNKKRAVAYFIGGGMSLWWSLIYLYIPLMIERSSLGVEWIGYFLFAIAFPLILCEYLFSKIAAKKGYKKMFILGYSILALCALTSFFFTNIYFILGTLALASFGAAMIEPTAEAYFFTVLKNKREEAKYYGSYNTALDLNLFVGKVIPAGFLLFLPFKSIFIIFGFMMIVMAFVSSKVRG
ncbi:MAG: MFS transporter [Nanoarchaeota archaeon]|nr:MFS transporter [Nanoarchaeota archaeon]